MARGCSASREDCDALSRKPDEVLGAAVMPTSDPKPALFASACEEARRGAPAMGRGEVVRPRVIPGIETKVLPGSERFDDIATGSWMTPMPKSVGGWKGWDA